MPNVSIENLDKASVLKALHDASKAPEDERQFCPMSEAMAKRFIEGGQTRFDFVNRRALKFDIGGSEFDASAYDELNGAGVAERVISGLRGPVAEASPEPAAATESQAAPVAAEPEPVAVTESQAAAEPEPVAVTESQAAAEPEPVAVTESQAAAEPDAVADPSVAVAVAETLPAPAPEKASRRSRR